jgi:hypothetical protein
MVRPHGYASSTYHFIHYLYPQDTNYVQGKLNRTMGSQPAHQDVCGAVNELCAKTIVDVELQLAQQKESDEAEAKKLVEKRMAAEREEKERQEKIKRMEQELQEMRSVDVDLAPEQHPVQYVQQAAGGDDEEDEDEDEEDEELASESAVDEPQVRLHIHIYRFFGAYLNRQLHDYNRGVPRNGPSVNRRTPAKGCLK